MITRRHKAALALFGLTLAAAALVVAPNNKARSAATRLRREMLQQGFKLQTSEFARAVDDDSRARATVLCDAGRECRDIVGLRELEFMKPAGSNSAVVAWKEGRLGSDLTEDLWPTLEEHLGAARKSLDNACASALAGPIRMEPTISPGIVELRSLAFGLASRTVLELHHGNHDTTWTNLLALVRLGTACDTPPVEFAYSTRFLCVHLAERATWEALQSPGWSDDELRALQREWESADFFAGLADTAAWARAQGLEFCQHAAQQPAAPGVPLLQIGSDFIGSPGKAWGEMTIGWRESRYRNYGVFEQETAILEYYRERELELRRATNAATWLEARSLPGVTNPAAPPVNFPIIASPGLGFGFRQGGGPGSPRQPQSMLARAAEAETRRRLSITAVALQRYRLAHHEYPASLEKLSPEFLRAVPIDFMDGRALRYSTSDGLLVLYSTGLDCADDGGQMRRDEGTGPRYGRGFGFGFSRSEGPDLVWPRPATPSETQAVRLAQANAREQSLLPDAPGPSASRRIR